ncbi:MAG: hypothetical protein JW867_04170, partial [Candidatus Omnitrophica bacterium]|nr:hypothetical protein [Candidatus Omnitrophota bacterium]
MRIKRILIFNPFGIGDVLFSTPLVRNLKDSFPEAKITYLCNRRTLPILKGNIFIDELLVFEKDEWRALARDSKINFIKHFFSFRNQIRQGNFDILFDLSLNPQYGLFFK